MTEPKTALTDMEDTQWDEVTSADDTYSALTAYALLADTELPPVLRDDQMEI